MIPCGMEDVDLVAIAFGIKAVDARDRSHVAFALPAFDMNQEMQRVGDIGADGFIGQVDIGLKRAVGEAAECLRSGVGVDGGKASRVAGVESLEKIEGFRTADFA